MLKSLELGYSGVKDAHMGKLTSLPSLEELCLDSCPVGDWTIAHLADNNVVPNLTSLDLADTDLTDAGMPKLATFNLKRLSLFYCNITNAGLQHVGKMKSLEVLNLDSREISDEGLRHLQQLRNLKSLDIFSGRITDAGCSHISAISSLESLELCGGGVGDLGCIALATLENLTCLNLSQNERITNRGAAALAALTKLKVLNLSNTRVNSSALRFFGGLLKLQSLALYGCRGIDHPGNLEKLQDELPNLKCLRLNRTSDQDGVVLTDGSSDDDSDSGMWSENGQQGSERMDQDLHTGSLSDHD
jgi:Leucine-rich repeat (LRR) protein